MDIMKEREHILMILNQVKSALKKNDYYKIKNLSEKIVHSSSTEQDPDIIFIAVVIYSLSKMIEREHYQEYPNWNIFYKNYIKNIDRLIDSLKKDDENLFHKNISIITDSIDKLTGQLKIYISDVFSKAKINKASKIYEHGISMSKTAKILNISIWELTEYAGQSKSSDYNLSITMPIRERIKFTEEFFK
jgi:hypothetical protein